MRRKFALLPLVLIPLVGCANDFYHKNDEQRIRRACAPSRVIRTDAQGYRGGNDTLAVFCADGRWIVLDEFKRPDFPKAQ